MNMTYTWKHAPLRYINDMAENIIFIKKELPEITMPDDLRAYILYVCDQFDLALNDIRKEIETRWSTIVDYEINKRNSEDAVKPIFENSFEFRKKFFTGAILPLRKMVEDPEIETKKDDVDSILLMLVMESTTNILNSFNSMDNDMNILDASYALESGN